MARVVRFETVRHHSRGRSGRRLQPVPDPGGARAADRSAHSRAVSSRWWRPAGRGSASLRCCCSSSLRWGLRTPEDRDLRCDQADPARRHRDPDGRTGRAVGAAHCRPRLCARARTRRPRGHECRVSCPTTTFDKPISGRLILAAADRRSHIVFESSDRQPCLPSRSWRPWERTRTARLYATDSSSCTACANACGASCGRLCPAPGTTRCSWPPLK